MSYMALYRKYRPSKFKEVIDQEPIVKTLKNSIKSGNISHAFLFSGPRGTGKTSVAKILAKSVNCLNPNNGERCGQCDICRALDDNDIDIIEIDAASNNGVDEIREIRNNVKLVPTIGKYKVYIIDEVHMLSIGAFNALLKTLEEPPQHVIFILATTEIQKIPLTIISRCQKFDFKKVTINCIVSLLKKILQEENKEVEEDVLNLIAMYCDGGVRDAINLLDQLLTNCNDKPTIEDIYSLNGEISETELELLFANIVECNIPNVLNQINDYYKEGKNLSSICERLIILVKNVNINNNVKNYFNKEITKKLDKFKTLSNEKTNLIAKRLLEMVGEIKKSNNQKIVVEIVTLEIMEDLKNNIIADDTLHQKEKSKNIEIEKANENDEIISREIISIRINNVLTEANKLKLLEYKTKFNLLTDFISNKKYNKIVNVLKIGNIIVASNKYIMFEYKKESEVALFYRNLFLIEKFLIEKFELNLKVVAVVNEDWDKIKKEYIQNKKNGFKYKMEEEPKIKETKNSKNIPKNIINIFGEESVDIK